MTSGSNLFRKDFDRNSERHWKVISSAVRLTNRRWCKLIQVTPEEGNKDERVTSTLHHHSEYHEWALLDNSWSIMILIPSCSTALHRIIWLYGARVNHSRHLNDILTDLQLWALVPRMRIPTVRHSIRSDRSTCRIHGDFIIHYDSYRDLERLYRDIVIRKAGRKVLRLQEVFYHEIGTLTWQSGPTRHLLRFHRDSNLKLSQWSSRDYVTRKVRRYWNTWDWWFFGSYSEVWVSE